MMKIFLNWRCFMGTKLNVLAIAICTMMVGGVAMASHAVKHVESPNVYVGLAGGVSFPANIKFDPSTIDMKSGYNLNGAVGYRYHPNVRFDMSFDYTHNKMKGGGYTGEATQYHVLLNGYYDIIMHNNLTPYLGAGIGYADLSYSDQKGGGTTLTSPGGGLGFQLAAGVNYQVRPNMLLGVGYRALATHIDGKHKGIAKSGTLYNNIVAASLTYYFSSL
jgi:opacity protein-like surface antigen